MIMERYSYVPSICDHSMIMCPVTLYRMDGEGGIRSHCLKGPCHLRLSFSMLKSYVPWSLGHASFPLKRNKEEEIKDFPKILRIVCVWELVTGKEDGPHIRYPEKKKGLRSENWKNIWITEKNLFIWLQFNQKLVFTYQVYARIHYNKVSGWMGNKTLGEKHDHVTREHSFLTY